MFQLIVSEPWPWYVAGPLVSITMFSLVYFGKKFGVSSNFRTMCSILGAGKKLKYFNNNWKGQLWNLAFLLGLLLGGFIASRFLMHTSVNKVSLSTMADLKDIGVAVTQSYLPDYLTFSNGFNFKPLLILLGGGFLVGFGTRWADGCTSGHGIYGLSNLQLPSLIAVIGFFIGGLLMTFFGLPLILG